MIVLGIDPGQHYGLVVIGTSPLRVLEHGTLTASSHKDPDDADAATLRRLCATVHDLVDRYQVDLVVAEQPLDAKPFWSAQKGGRREGTGTSFRSGVYFGLLRGAIPLALPFVSYPVHGFGARRGWMAPKANREKLLAHMRLVGKAAGGTLDTDHECMALGVALHHLSVLKVKL